MDQLSFCKGHDLKFLNHVILNVLIKLLRADGESKKGLHISKSTKSFHLGYQYILAN